ncbi:hypothetical protein BKA65DRAFT_222498 [Rhexocercosporidium sp. MPI-PUGE-AT-0058]|nr:hypothetical protein BKA65DRAFT_222498 [Rhexocercosporidium sp. MPI-PUGE-AT-0058]
MEVAQVIALISAINSTLDILDTILKRGAEVYIVTSGLELRLLEATRGLSQLQQTLEHLGDGNEQLDTAPTWIKSTEDYMKTMQQCYLLLSSHLNARHSQMRDGTMFWKELKGMIEKLHAHEREFCQIAYRRYSEMQDHTNCDFGGSDLGTWATETYSVPKSSQDSIEISAWEFCENVVLPFARREQVSHRGFGSVWRIKIHPAHQMLRRSLETPALTARRLATPIVNDYTEASGNRQPTVFARKDHYHDHLRGYYEEDLAVPSKQIKQSGARHYWCSRIDSLHLIGALNLGSALGMGGTYMCLNESMGLKQHTAGMQWILDETNKIIPSTIQDLPNLPDWAIFTLFATCTIIFTGTIFPWGSNGVQKPIAKALACLTAMLGMVGCVLAGFGAEEIVLVGLPLSVSIGILASYLGGSRSDEKEEWTEEKRGFVLEV